jgi:hypothetical protein
MFTVLSTSSVKSNAFFRGLEQEGRAGVCSVELSESCGEGGFSCGAGSGSLEVSSYCGEFGSVNSSCKKCLQLV